MELLIEEPQRKERLTQVQTSVEKFRPDLLVLIDSINDHKGCLEVYWKIDTPHNNDKKFMECLWYYAGELNIEHYGPGKILIEQVLI